MDIISLFSKIGISTDIAQNVIFILILIGVVFVLALVIGKRRLIPLLVSGYVSLAILSAAPKEYLVDYYYEAGFFLAILILISMYSKEFIDAYVSASGFLWRVFVLSFLEAMFFLSIIFSILPKKIALNYVSSGAYDLFVSPNFYLAWIVLPLVFIFLIRRKINH